MKSIQMKACLLILVFLSSLVMFSCSKENKDLILEHLNEEEYNRLMSMPSFDFDQSADGFRKYSNNYELTCLLVPEFIKVNKLSDREAGNLHWHLGQIHAFKGEKDAAISEMKQSYRGDFVTWDSYVKGSIAFLENDKASLQEALDTLRNQENQMNIEFLEKFITHFDKSYAEAYSASDW